PGRGHEHAGAERPRGRRRETEEPTPAGLAAPPQILRPGFVLPSLSHRDLRGRCLRDRHYRVKNGALSYTNRPHGASVAARPALLRGRQPEERGGAPEGPRQSARRPRTWGTSGVIFQGLVPGQRPCTAAPGLDT